MRPEDVPAELVEPAARALATSRADAQAFDGEYDPDGVLRDRRAWYRVHARAALAAVLPLHAVAVLDGARKELQVAYKRGPGASLAGKPSTWLKGFARAHRIVRDRADRLRAMAEEVGR